MTTGNRRWLPWLAALFVFIIGFGLYADTLGHDFVWDDYYLIVDNPAVKPFNAHTVLSVFTEDFWKISGPRGGYYRPLVALSFCIDYARQNGAPRAFHLTNVLLNALVGPLVFALVYLLFGNALFGLVAALIFAVHPVHTEAVAWISGRTDIMATLWILVSLCCYVLSRRRQSIPYLAVALVAFMFAMFSKETAASLPPLILLLEIGPFESLFTPGVAPESRTWRVVRNTILFCAVLVAYMILRRHAIGEVSASYPAHAPGALGHVALPLSILGGYVYKVLLPLKLSAEYDAPVPTSFIHPAVIAGAVALGAIVWATWRLRRRTEVVLGVGIFLLGLLPALNVIPIGEVSAERFLYFPSLGLAIILGRLFAAALQTRLPALSAAGPERVRPSAARVLTVLLPVVLLVSAYKTFERTPDWRNNDTLFAKTIAQEPKSELAYGSLAWAAFRRGDFDAAARSYRRALELNPDYRPALNGMAMVFEQQGRYQDALPLAAKAVRLEPTNVAYIQTLGELYMGTGQFSMAVTQFQRALALDADNGAALNNLAIAYARQGRFADALGPAQRALQLSPDDPIRINNLGSLYMDLKQYDKATEQFERALALDPHQPNAHYNLGRIRYEQGDAAGARAHFMEAARRGGDVPLAYFYLALIDHAAGNEASAKEWAQRFLDGYAQNDEYRRQAEAIAAGGR